MYNVLDVSRYIINYSNDKGYEISNLRLQKLLYFVQACFLIEKGKECFSEAMEAWAYGPVVPVSYREFKVYANTEIPKIDTYYEYDIPGDIWSVSTKKFDYNCIPYTDRKLIEGVVDTMKDYGTLSLVNITHAQDPWKNAYGNKQSNVITSEAIREFFSE